VLKQIVFCGFPSKGSAPATQLRRSAHRGRGRNESLLRLVILEQGAQRWGINPAALGATIGRQKPPNAVYLFAAAWRRIMAARAPIAES